jgi:hypothetical protein
MVRATIICAGKGNVSGSPWNNMQLLLFEMHLGIQTKTIFFFWRLESAVISDF